MTILPSGAGVDVSSSWTWLSLWLLHLTEDIRSNTMWLPRLAHVTSCSFLVSGALALRVLSWQVRRWMTLRLTSKEATCKNCLTASAELLFSNPSSVAQYKNEETVLEVDYSGPAISAFIHSDNIRHHEAMRTILTMPFPNYWYIIFLSKIKWLLIYATKLWVLCYAVIDNWNNRQGMAHIKLLRFINTMFMVILSSLHIKAISLALELRVLLWIIGPWNIVLILCFPFFHSPC